MTMPVQQPGPTDPAMEAGRYRLLLDTIPHMVWMTRSDGFTEYANQQIVKFLGHPEEQIQGWRWLEILHPDDQERSRRLWETVLQTGSAYRNEYRVRHRNGTYLWCLSQAVPLREADGTIVQWVGTWTDIDDLKRTEQQLRLRDRAVQAITQGILITDPNQPDHPITYVSPGFERLTGYTAAEVVGRNCRFLQGPETDRTALAHLSAAVHQGQACTVELLNYRKDGTSFWNELSIAPVRDEAGRVTQFVGVQTDITQRRRLEEQYRQAQKMEAIGQLAGGVAHDFNNLLTVISGYSELLLQALANQEALRGLVDEIRKAAVRAASLTRQLLAFSRKQVLAPRRLDLNEVVRDTEKMLCRLIGEDVELVTNLQPRLPLIQADPGQLEQVLLNLAVNARDAMPQGGTLTIETRENIAEPWEQRRSEILLLVRDTGQGMTEEIKRHIFEPFFTTKGVGKGTGLGLAVVHGIIEQSEGHIVVDSEPGRGTTFVIHLPCLEESTSPDRSAPTLQPIPGGAETVLLVEDDDRVRGLALQILQSCGYTVLEAGHGEVAIQLAAAYRAPIHLLATDVIMPGLGGVAVATRVQELHPEAKVLYLSGYTDDAVMRHGVMVEQVEFLQKPFTPRILAQKVRDILSRS